MLLETYAVEHSSFSGVDDIVVPLLMSSYCAITFGGSGSFPSMLGGPIDS